MQGGEQARVRAAILRQQRRNRWLKVSLWLLVAVIVLCGIFLFWLNLQPRTSNPRASSPPSSRPPSATPSGLANVLDGDTLEIGSTRIRLYGIDAPESDQTCQRGGKVYGCGRDAAFALADLVKNNTVTCTQKDTDRYGRTVAVCRVGNTDVNGWMVAQGHALAYRAYSTDYVPQEAAARQARRGLHAGIYVEPWNYRKGDTTPAPLDTMRQPYASCAQARAAGRTPVIRGESGYNPKLDGDGDGKMCE